ncbi:MAG TPA: adenosylmethionine--8-amino-7-oxononanoate transaminase [Planctomycetota bacterium]|nr:adenosylmethionine--8-amino-7-oxononanoate transaminase [Planctomycetota bacterium]
MNSAERRDLSARDARVLWHPYTQHGLEPEPLPVAAAHGALLTLEDGREVIDAISSWWTCLHGHAHPRLVEALHRQAQTLDHVLFAGCTHEPAVQLAEHLLDCAPRGLARVFFSDDGSTAVEVALKIVLQDWVHRAEPERRVFVALEGGYHGDTFGAMAVGERAPFFEPFAPLLFEVRQAAPRTDAVDAALDELGPRAAGVILEPLVQGAGGMRMQPESFVRDVRRACDRAGVPMIADEVMTAFGRTGALFACQRAGISPDVLCVAKGLTGGVLPLAATLVTESLFSDFVSIDRRRTFFHGHSFTANPIGCAVALASLDLCLENDVAERFDLIGARIETHLRQAGIDDSRANNLRRKGGIVALDLVPREGGPGYLTGDVLHLRREALQRGVLLRPLGNVLYAMPPACTSEEQCDRIAQAMVELAME